MKSSDNMVLYEKFREVPEEAKKEIKAGRTKGFTDINPMWRIKKLTEQFGPIGIGWYYKPIKKWLENVGNEYAAFVDIELYIKVDGEWSQPISGTGGSKFATTEKSGVYVSDECYKMATTDAISVSCKQLGIGADVYFDGDRTKYDMEKDPLIREKDRNLLLQAAERTGLNLDVAMKKWGIKSIENITTSVYTKWMIQMANAESKVPKAPEGKEENIEDASKDAPFK